MSDIVTEDRNTAIGDLRRPVIGSAINGMHKQTRELMGVEPAHFPIIRAAKFDPVAVLPPDAIPDDMVDRFAIVGPRIALPGSMLYRPSASTRWGSACRLL